MSRWIELLLIPASHLGPRYSIRIQLQCLPVPLPNTILHHLTPSHTWRGSLEVALGRTRSHLSMYDGSHESAGDLKKKYVPIGSRIVKCLPPNPTHYQHLYAPLRTTTLRRACPCVVCRIAKLKVALWETENGIKFDTKKHQKKFSEMKPRHDDEGIHHHHHHHYPHHHHHHRHHRHQSNTESSTSWERRGAG